MSDDHFDLQAYYDEWHSKNKTIAQIANAIYRGTSASGVLNHYDISVRGFDVKDDLAKLTILLTAYFDKVAINAEEKVNEISSMADFVQKAYEAFLDDQRIIDLRPLLSYSSVSSMVADRNNLTPGMVVRTEAYYENSIKGGAEYEIYAGGDRGGDVKLDTNKYAHIRGVYVTPEQFGARGDGETDDSEAFKKAFDLLNEYDVHLTSGSKYLITKPVRIEKAIHLVGAQDACITFEKESSDVFGCFIISSPIYDSSRTYNPGDYCVNNPNIDDPGIIYKMNENRQWATTLTRDVDIKNTERFGNGSIFDSVIFAWCYRCFSGKLTYLTFSKCKFFNCNCIFYCEGESENKKPQWFGKIDFNDCDFRYNREIFYLSKINYDQTYTLSLNAVTFNGGLINSSNLFLQTPSHNFNNEFRTESLLFNGCDIEKSDIYMSISEDIDLTSNGNYNFRAWDEYRVPWIGGLYIYNTVFSACHIELFAFLYHGYTPYNPENEQTRTRGLIRSQVMFENCYIQATERCIIECFDVQNSGNGGMYQSGSGENCFLVSFLNCPMTIKAQMKLNTDSSGVIGNDHYILDQPSVPFVRMEHPEYGVIFDNYSKNILLNYFEGRLPAFKTSGGSSTYSPVTVSVEYMTALKHAQNILSVYTMKMAQAAEAREGGDSEAADILEAEANEITVPDFSKTVAASLLGNSASSAKVVQLTGADSFSTDLSSDTTLLDNKSAYYISVIINASTNDKLVRMFDRFITILNGTDGEHENPKHGINNVYDTGIYLNDSTVRLFLKSEKQSINMHVNKSGQTVTLNQTARHIIYDANRLYTSYTNALNTRQFVKDLPNGIFVITDANGSPSSLSLVINANNKVQVLKLAEIKNDLKFLVLKANDGNNFTGRTEYQNCVSLERVDFEFTPSSNSLPSDLFSGCTALTDIYVPWAEGTVENAKWGATNATIHYNS